MQAGADDGVSGPSSARRGTGGQRARGGGWRRVHPDNRSAAAALSEAQRPCRACSGNPPCEFHECRNIPDGLAEASCLVGAFSRTGSTGPGPGAGAASNAGDRSSSRRTPHVSGTRARKPGPACSAGKRSGRPLSTTGKQHKVRTADAEIPEPGRKLRCRCNGDCGSSPGAGEPRVLRWRGLRDAMAMAVQARVWPCAAERRSRVARRPCSREFRGNGGSSVKGNAWRNSGSLRRRRFGADGSESNDLIRKRKPPRRGGAAAGACLPGRGPGGQFPPACTTWPQEPSSRTNAAPKLPTIALSTLPPTSVFRNQAPAASRPLCGP